MWRDESIVATPHDAGRDEHGRGQLLAELFDPAAVAKAFDLPENEQVLMLLDLGFAAEGFVPLPNHTSRKPLEETVKYL